MSKYPEGEIEWGIKTLETMVEYEETLTKEDKEKLFVILIDANFLFEKKEKETK